MSNKHTQIVVMAVLGIKKGLRVIRPNFFCSTCIIFKLVVVDPQMCAWYCVLFAQMTYFGITSNNLFFYFLLKIHHVFFLYDEGSNIVVIFGRLHLQLIELIWFNPFTHTTVRLFINRADHSLMSIVQSSGNCMIWTNEWFIFDFWLLYTHL